MMSVEDEMRLIYENRLKRQLKEGIEKGVEQELEQVRKQCIEQGLKQGRNTQKAEIAKTMKANGYSAGEISKITRLPVEEIEKL